MRRVGKKPWEKLTVEEVDVLVQQQSRLPSDAVAKEIGRFVVYWSNVDLAFFHLIRKLCKGADTYELVVMIGTQDIYRKCDIATALGKKYLGKGEWLDELGKLTGIISGMREFRNRLAHDHWVTQENAAQRVQFKPKMKEGPGSLIGQTEVSPEEIRDQWCKLALCGIAIKSLHERAPGGAQPD